MGCASSTPGRVALPDARPAPSLTSEFEVRVARAAAPCDFHRDYLLGHKLGAGSFASVFSARRTTGGRDFAVKIIDPRAEDAQGHRTEAVDLKRQRAIEREAAVAQDLPRSANIVEFFGLYIGKGLSYFVMERCDMRLLAFLEGMPLVTESALKPVFEDMLSAIAVCHTAGIVHRDVKCDNFLVSAEASGKGFSVKLCDFGLASKAAGRQLVGVCGTPVHMAPEMLRGERYGASVDVWALGVLAYLLLFGGWPYMPANPTTATVKAAIRLGSPAPQFRSHAGLPDISGDCATWVGALLCREAEGRPSAKAALADGCFRRRWSSAASLGDTLCAAAGSGAFAAVGVSSELGVGACRLGAKRHHLSEASTSASGPAH